MQKPILQASSTVLVIILVQFIITTVIVIILLMLENINLSFMFVYYILYPSFMRHLTLNCDSFQIPIHEEDYI